MSKKITISACIPCMNRTYDLEKAMPSIIKSANASPPVEIVVLDYNSTDDLEEYIKKVKKTSSFSKGNKISYHKYRKGKYYHLTHAYNLSVKLSEGEYFALLGTDTIVKDNYFKVVRKMLNEDDYVWLYYKYYGGIFVCQKKEFIDAGGFDERFEHYGPEDKDIELRLRRRGGKIGILPAGLLTTIPTSRVEKFKNYRPIAGSSRKRYTKELYLKNKGDHVLVANKGKEWGKWKK